MSIEEKLNEKSAKDHKKTGEEETIREHTDKVKEKAKKLRQLNYISEDKYQSLNLACEYHDYGKLNSKFQERMKTGKRFNPKEEVGHNILSTYFIKKEALKDRGDYESIYYAVLNHHYYVRNNEDELIKTEEMAKELLKDFYIEELDIGFVDNLDREKNSELDILTGLLNKCDYAGSGNYEVEYKNDFQEEALEVLKATWSKPQWNPLQEYMKENRDKNTVVIASTGMGKTEAGLLWMGNTKGFFVLPLRTAINSIYSRIREGMVKPMLEKEIKDNLEKEINKRVVLLHSEAADFLLSNYPKEMSYDEVKEYMSEGKALSIPLSISTLDQIFNFVFLYNGFELKLATLSYSKIVIDEIQAYSADLLAYIVVGLKKIKDAGGKFAILTATLPPFIKDYLEEELEEEINPKQFLTDETRHSLKVLDEEINEKFIYSYYQKNRGKTLVICNTVKKAQEIYDKFLKLGVDKNEIELFHSKFIKKDRTKKEREILEFGKTEILGNKIWISTSLIEASLDIDFDVIFTELNDLSGLFQRLGRVNRKGKKEIKKYNAYVYTKIDSKLFVGEDFIDEIIFKLSKEALKKIDGLLSEKTKCCLIEKYLTTENMKKSNFNKKFYKYKKYMKYLIKGKIDKKEVAEMFRDILTYKSIPEEIYKENKKEIDKLIESYMDETNKEKEKAKIELERYIISLRCYEKIDATEPLKLGKEKIYIVEGNYSYERGFQKIKGLKVKQKKEENIL